MNEITKEIVATFDELSTVHLKDILDNLEKQRPINVSRCDAIHINAAKCLLNPYVDDTIIHSNIYDLCEYKEGNDRVIIALLDKLSFVHLQLILRSEYTLIRQLAMYGKIEVIKYLFDKGINEYYQKYALFSTLIKIRQFESFKFLIVNLSNAELISALKIKEYKNLMTEAIHRQQWGFAHVLIDNGITNSLAYVQNSDGSISFPYDLISNDRVKDYEEAKLLKERLRP